VGYFPRKFGIDWDKDWFLMAGLLMALRILACIFKVNRVGIKNRACNISTSYIDARERAGIAIEAGLLLVYQSLMVKPISNLVAWEVMIGDVLAIVGKPVSNLVAWEVMIGDVLAIVGKPVSNGVAWEVMIGYIGDYW